MRATLCEKKSVSESVHVVVRERERERELCEREQPCGCGVKLLHVIIYVVIALKVASFAREDVHVHLRV